MKPWKGSVILALVSLMVAACGRPAPPGQAPERPGAQMVEVSMREWAFDPSPLVAKAGTVTFRIKNDGGVDHNFLVENMPGAQVEAIKSGDSKTLTVKLAPGQYTIFCNLPGHREAGMVGILKVE